MFRRLANGFAQSGLSVDLVLTDAGGPNLDGLCPAVRIVDLKSRRLLRSARPLTHYLNAEKPDVLLATLDHANLIAVWARSLARASPKLILREANTLSVAARRSADVRDLALPFVARALYPLADAVVAVSKGVATDLVEKIGIPRTTVRVIYNPTFGHDILPLMQESLSHPWFADGGPPIVLAAGRLTSQKRFDILVHAVSLVSKLRPVRLVILGEGEERGKLESLIHELEAGSFISLPGFVTNPYSYMAQADLGVVSSEWEGFPNTIVEAFASGLPVVSTDCPSGPREILELRGPGTGKFGTLVPVNDSRSLVSAIVHELGLKRNQADLKARAQHFTDRRAIRAYVDLMSAVVESQR